MMWVFPGCLGDPYGCPRHDRSSKICCWSSRRSWVIVVLMMGGWSDQIANQNLIATLPRHAPRAPSTLQGLHACLCAASLRDSGVGVWRPFEYHEPRGIRRVNNVANWAHGPPIFIVYTCIRIVYIYGLGPLSGLGPRPLHPLPTPRAGPALINNAYYTTTLAKNIYWDIHILHSKRYSGVRLVSLQSFIVQLPKLWMNYVPVATHLTCDETLSYLSS
jgi:hypothetical protein